MTPTITRILVPVDFSSNSVRALDYAKGFAAEFGASLLLLHVCDAPSMATGSMDAYATVYGDWSQKLGAEAERELLKLAQTVTSGPVSTEVLFGHPARAIVAAAEKHQADLIVMGTHGHGAVMHVVLGNVAERVVRTATCPVLTVREPRDVARRSRPRVAVAAAMLLAGLLAPATALPAAAQGTQPPAQERTTATGPDVFRTHCATCHGAAARGDGVLASSMRRKPADLTMLANRNGGQYPSEMVYRTIDGRQPVRGHGGPDMPVWGDVFLKSRYGGNEAAVKELVSSLVKFLESIQSRPGQ